MNMLAKAKSLFGFRDKEVEEKTAVSVEVVNTPLKSDVLAVLQTLKGSSFGLGWHRVGNMEKAVSFLEAKGIVMVDGARQNFKANVPLFSCRACIGFQGRTDVYSYDRCKIFEKNLSQMLALESGRACGSCLNRQVSEALKGLE